MTNLTPKISIICPSYNHGQYVGKFIQSILNQSEQDFEILIIDDCSTDDNVMKILRFSDPRIRLIEHDFNMGVSAATNEGIKSARADIIALMASDDLARPDYLEKVLAVFEKRPEISVIYVALQHIDQEGNLKERFTHLPNSLNRHEILKRSFLGENQLPSPGMAMRKRAALSAMIPMGSIQYSDWILHNQLLLHHDIYLLNEPLILYRMSLESLSSRSEGVIAREGLEISLLMDSFLGTTDLSLLELIFGNDLHAYGKISPETVPYFLSRIAIESPVVEKQRWGYLTLARFISQPGVQENLHSSYGFDFKAFMALTPIPNHHSSSKTVSRYELNLMRKKIRRLKRCLLALAFFTLVTLYACFE
jgi:glycosyltransferase involved in cell wall biosynthesis